MRKKIKNIARGIIPRLQARVDKVRHKYHQGPPKQDKLPKRKNINHHRFALMDRHRNRERAENDAELYKRLNRSTRLITKGKFTGIYVGPQKKAGGHQ